MRKGVWILTWISFICLALIAGLQALALFGCGSGGGGTSTPAPRVEAVDVTLSAPPAPAPAAVVRTAVSVRAATPAIEAQATNVGNVTVRGFILSHYDGGGGNTPGNHNLYLCQKCFDFKDNTDFGGCNFILPLYERDCGPVYTDNGTITVCGKEYTEALCKPGINERLYMFPGHAYCDNPEENPEIDCTHATWRVLTLPILGDMGGGGKLAPGESMTYGFGYTYEPGTYHPSAAVYRWDGTLFDNEAKTLIVE